MRALSYNILCERYATTQAYGYVPERVLSWAYRKTLIFDEIKDQNADIVCLQELDKASYDDFFRGKLAECGYNGYFAQKSRAETLGENAKYVDGCGTFWKDKKYVKLDTQHLVLGRKAVERPGAKASADMLNRVWQRDDIATVVFLENRQTGARLIIVNAHIVWNPAFKDVKLIQAAVMMEELSKLSEKYAKQGPATNKQAFRFADADDTDDPPPELAPSMEYSSLTKSPSSSAATSIPPPAQPSTTSSPRKASTPVTPISTAATTAASPMAACPTTSPSNPPTRMSPTKCPLPTTRPFSATCSITSGTATTHYGARGC